jgi:hypothetical protein
VGEVKLSRCVGFGGRKKERLQLGLMDGERWFENAISDKKL